MFWRPRRGYVAGRAEQQVRGRRGEGWQEGRRIDGDAASSFSLLGGGRVSGSRRRVASVKELVRAGTGGWNKQIENSDQATGLATRRAITNVVEGCGWERRDGTLG